MPRVFDAAALLLIAGGVTVYLYAHQGMSRLASGRMQHAALTGANAGWNLTAWGNYDRLSRIGAGVAAGGVLLSIAAYAWFKLRRPPALLDEQANHQ